MGPGAVVDDRCCPDSSVVKAVRQLCVYLRGQQLASDIHAVAFRVCSGPRSTWHVKSDGSFKHEGNQCTRPAGSEDAAQRRGRHTIGLLVSCSLWVACTRPQLRLSSVFLQQDGRGPCGQVVCHLEGLRQLLLNRILRIETVSG